MNRSTGGCCILSSCISEKMKNWKQKNEVSTGINVQDRESKIFEDKWKIYKKN
jgi:hypothetical protein